MKDYRNIQEYETKYLGEITQNIWKISGKISDKLFEKYETNYLRNIEQNIWELSDKMHVVGSVGAFWCIRAVAT